MPVAGVTSTLTSLIGNHGIYAVFLLMAIDAVLPAASELVMLYAGALAVGAFAGQHVDLFGSRISSHAWAYVAMALAGAGYGLGNSYERFHRDFRFADYAVAAAIITLVVYLIVRRRRSSRLSSGAPDSYG